MKRYKIVLICFILLLTISLFSLVIYNKNNSNDGKKNDITTDINYSSGDYNVDFSNYQTYDVNLSDVSNVFNITKDGVYNLNGNLNGYINISGYVKIILNEVNINSNNSPCIYVENSKGTYIEHEKESTLKDNSTYSGFDTEVDGTIYSKDDLIFLGEGTLNISANNQDGIVSKDNTVIKSGNLNITSADDAIRGKDSVTILNGNITINGGGDGIKSSESTDGTKGDILIENGTINITSALDSLQASNNIKISGGSFTIKTGKGSTITSTSSSWNMNEGNSSKTDKSIKGIKATNNIEISNATISLNTQDDAIHSNNEVVINSGTITILSGDDGIHADSKITINNGIISINQSYEGIEANNITINNGQINVKSSDDGINVSGGNDNSAQNRPGQNNYSTTDSNILLTINGGIIKVVSQGDGLDSDGSILMNGGEVYVDGPTENNNGALDYNNNFNISGGTLIAVGSSGMAQGISSTSTQYGVLINLTSAKNAGTNINIEGVINYTPSKSFQSIVISTPNLKKSSSYNLFLNNSSYTTFTISSILTTVGNSSRNGR